MLRLFAVLVLAVITASAQTDPAEAVLAKMATNMKVRPLQGLTACGVAIEDLSGDAIRGGLNERALQRMITAQLTGLGVRVTDGPSFDRPFLSATVLVSRLGNAGYTFAVLMELREMVTPERDQNAMFLVTTWRQLTTGTADRNGLPSKVADALLLVLNDLKQGYALANRN